MSTGGFMLSKPTGYTTMRVGRKTRNGKIIKACPKCGQKGAYAPEVPVPTEVEFAAFIANGGRLWTGLLNAHVYHEDAHRPCWITNTERLSAFLAAGRIGEGLIEVGRVHVRAGLREKFPGVNWKARQAVVSIPVDLALELMRGT